MTNVFHIVSNKNWGGPEQYAYDLISRLKDDDRYYVELVCKQKAASVADRFRRLEIPISLLPMKGKTDIDSAVRLARQIKRGKNILHVHNMADAFLAIVARKISENKNTRVILTCHTVEHPRLNFIHKRIYNELDKIVFVSNLAYNEFTTMRPNVDKKKLEMIHDSVIRLDDAPSTIDIRKTYNIPDDKALILFHGRVCPEKGVDVLLRAVAQLDKSTFHLLIAGEAKPKFLTQLKGFVVANRLVRNVTFLGFHDELQGLVKQCDFGALPAVWREPFGISNLEYMMQGKAHIATTNGAQREYLHDGENAILVPPSDFSALAAALKNLIDNPDLRDKIGKQALIDFNESLSYDRFYEAMTSLYERVHNSK